MPKILRHIILTFRNLKTIKTSFATGFIDGGVFWLKLKINKTINIVIMLCALIFTTLGDRNQCPPARNCVVLCNWAHWSRFLFKRECFWSLWLSFRTICRYESSSWTVCGSIVYGAQRRCPALFWMSLVVLVMRSVGRTLKTRLAARRWVASRSNSRLGVCPMWIPELISPVLCRQLISPRWQRCVRFVLRNWAHS